MSAKVWLFDIAGVKFGDYKQALDNGLAEGDELGLVLEPENQYDDKAIKIMGPLGHKLGYVPNKDEMQTLKAALYENVDGYRATLSILNEEESTWRMFTVLVEEKV